MSSSSISTAAADHCGGTSITAVHPDIIQSHILNKLDGPTLAATSCASAQLLSLCSDDYLWKDICNSTWPSTADRRVRAAISAFPSGHRSLYSDAFPALRRQHHQSSETHHRRRDFSNTPELISAVDIFYDDKLIYSKVLVTETISTWFLCTPLRLDLLDPKETVATPSEFGGGGAWTARTEERLRVSWILIDPVRRRVVNVASREAVAARRHWLTGDVQLRFAVVAAAGGGGGELVECAVVVSCRGSEDGEVRVREVSMQVEDMEGRILTGMDSLGILQAAMAEQRMKSDGKTERDNYEIFLRMKAQCRERKQRREKGMDTVCIATGISIFFAFLIFFSVQMKILS